MPDVDASVLAIVFHFSLYSCSRLSRLELEIRDYEVKVDEIVEWLLRIFFRIRTDCMTIRPTSVIIALMVPSMRNAEPISIMEATCIREVFDEDEVDVK